MVDEDHPFPPLRALARSIRKSVVFNPMVSEVGYTDYERLRVSTTKSKITEKMKFIRDCEKKGEFFQLHGFTMQEHYNEETGLYKQRWYNQEYNSIGVYKLRNTYKRIKRKTSATCWNSQDRLRDGLD